MTMILILVDYKKQMNQKIVPALLLKEWFET